MAHEVLKNLLVLRQHEVVVVLQQPVHPGHAVHVVLPVCKEKEWLKNAQLLFISSYLLSGLKELLSLNDSMYYF